MKKIIFLLILLFCKASIQSQNNKTNALAYIKDYYTDFKTGYDSPGGYFTVTDHYKVELEESVFTISYDTYMYRKFIKTETIQFDLKKVESVYNRGTVCLEFENGFVRELVSSSIGFKSKTMDYSLNIKPDRSDMLARICNPCTHSVSTHESCNR